MRSGTVPHTLVVGLGAACEIAGEEMEVRNGHTHTTIASVLDYHTL